MNRTTWLGELAHELAAREIDPAQAAAILVEVEGYLIESASAPLDDFGPPASYADAVVAALQPGHLTDRPAGTVRLRAQGISAGFGSRRILRDIDVDLRAGEVTLVLGPNGCGKSTLLRVLAGLLPARSGSVEVDGAIGYAPQHAGLNDHLRPDEHFILFGAGRGLDRADAVRQGRMLADQLGWDAAGAAVAGDLSGGTRQKLNVVLAGLGDPEVLLLDEPYQGLDLDSSQRFWELLWTWRDQGRAALVVTHARDAISRADHVVELPVDACTAR